MLLILVYIVSTSLCVISDDIQTEGLDLMQEKQCSLIPFETYQPACNAPIKSGSIPNYGSCVYSDAKGNSKQIYCQNGNWLDLSNTRHLSRRKRGILGAIWGGVKRFFTPISNFVGGTISGIACAIFGCRTPDPIIIINNPPTITCPEPQPSSKIVAAHLQKSVEVTWTKPTPTDPEDDAVSVSGGNPPSGSLFEHGYHSIVYTATDTHGNKDSCTISFRVTVQYCWQNLYVPNGRAICDRSDRIHGTKCDFICDDGYQLTNDSVLNTRCEGTSFTGGKVECEKKTCDQPSTICNGDFLCPGNDYMYEAVCFSTCNNGYETERSHYIECNGETWDREDTILECKDDEPPSFDHCPPYVLTRYTDRGTSIATNVSWEQPRANDNSQQGESCSNTVIQAPLIDQIHGFPPGSDFPEGFYDISYQASDTQGLTSTCTFFIKVEKISCDPLVLVDKYIKARCPTGFSYGSACQLSCFLTYAIKGDESVTCELDESGRHGYWAWTNNTESLCERLECPDLPPPANGALTCSYVLSHKVCTMSCNERYQTPIQPSAQFECDKNQEWFPGIPKNCTERRNPNLAVTEGSLVYFYSGDCNDEATKTSLNNTFISAMDDLVQRRDWSNTCQSDCGIGEVTVTCGPTTGRRKRDVFEYFRYKRASNEIKISFKVKTKWLLEGDYWFNDNHIVAVNKEIEKVVNNDTLNYDGQKPTFVYTYSSIECLEGSLPDYYTDSCRGCAPGTYLDFNAEECKDCAKGFYQEDEFKSSCIACPPGMSTEGKGSNSLSDCIDMCRPGTYSNTGVIPCSPCIIGEYQPTEGSVLCLRCDKGLFTVATGSIVADNCSAFDVILPAKNRTALKSITTASVDFTLGFWVYMTNGTTSLASLELSGFTFTIGSTFSVSHSGESKTEIVGIQDPIWAQIAILWTKSNNKLDMYMDRVMTLSHTFSSAVDTKLSIGDSLEVQPSKKLKLTGLVLYPVVSSDVLDRTCSPNVTDSLYTMSDFLNVQISDIDTEETSCDELNECSLSPCGSRNKCTNKRGGYTCICTGGFTGDNCQDPPDFCLNNECKNGATCESLQINYTCHCTNGYKGPLCSKTTVNGGWSAWVEWTECSQSCGGGTKLRTRFCDNPTPEPSGLNCSENNTDIQECGDGECPYCQPFDTVPDLTRAHSFNCTESENHITCTVTCRDGFVMLSGTYNIECGKNTSFEWNNARLPRCSRFDFTKKVESTFSIPYDATACADKVDIKAKTIEQLQDTPCVSKGSCVVRVDNSGCGSENNGKRSTSDLALIVSYTSSLAQVTDTDIYNFYASNIVSEELADWIEKYSDFMLTSQEILNDSNFFTVDVNGNIYETKISSVNLTSSMECPTGLVEYNAVCAYCPAGTYWDNGLCVLCPIGTYQDQNGQQQCLSCPAGLTTPFTASINETECSIVTPNVTETSTSVTNDIDRSIKTTVTTTGGPVVVETTTRMDSADQTTDYNGNAVSGGTETSTSVANDNDQLLLSVATEGSSDFVASSPAQDNVEQKTTSDDNGNEIIIIVSAVAGVAFLAVVSGVTALIYKKNTRCFRFENQNSRFNSMSSLASLNKIRPTLPKANIGQAPPAGHAFLTPQDT